MLFFSKLKSIKILAFPSPFNLSLSKIDGIFLQ